MSAGTRFLLALFGLLEALFLLFCAVAVVRVVLNDEENEIGLGAAFVLAFLFSHAAATVAHAHFQ